MMEFSTPSDLTAARPGDRLLPPPGRALDHCLAAAHLAWWRIDAEGQLSFSSEAALCFAEEICPRYPDSWPPVYEPSDASRLQEALERLRGEGISFDLVLQRAVQNGTEPSYHRVTGVAYTIEEALHRCGLIEDVSASRRIDRRLGEALEAQRDFAARLGAVLFRVGHDTDGRPVTHFISDQAEILFGIPLADLIANWQTIRGRVHPEDVQAFLAFATGAGSLEGSHGIDARIRAGDGWRRVHFEFRCWKDRDACLRWDGVATELQASPWEHLGAGEQKAALWERLETASGLVLVLHDETPARRLLRVSDSVQRILGHSPAELLAADGPGLRELCHPDDRPLVERHLTATAAMAEGESSQVEVRLRHRLGHWVWIRATETPCVTEGEPAMRLLGMAQDVTEMKRAGAWNERRTALDIVGKVAGGVAHDFNNLLTIITANLSLVQEGSLSREEEGTCLDQVLAATETAGRLTRQLLAFAHTGRPRRRDLDPALLLRDVAEVTLRGTNAACRFEIEAAGAGIAADESLIRQMFHHLVQNAAQAAGLRCEVICRLRRARPEEVPRGELPQGDYVVIEIEDDGPGIDPALRARIFEPFFTTRPDQSGLGLALAQHIAVSHGGLIVCEPLNRRGALFRIFLPAVALPQLEPPTRATGEFEDWIGPPPKVLMLDDDADVMAPYARILQLVGFDVTATTEEAACLEAFLAAMRSPQPFDVVVLDLTMPGTAGGVAVLAKLREIDPRVLAIAHSGYSEDNALQHPEEYGFRAGLAKPAPITRLVALLKQLAMEARAVR